MVGQDNPGTNTSVQSMRCLRLRTPLPVSTYHHECAPLYEVGTRKSHRRSELEAIGDAHAESLAEEELPVLSCHGGREDAKKLHHAAGDVDLSKVASVEGSTGELWKRSAYCQHLLDCHDYTYRANEE